MGSSSGPQRAALCTHLQPCLSTLPACSQSCSLRVSSQRQQAAWVINLTLESKSTDTVSPIRLEMVRWAETQKKQTKDRARIGQRYPKKPRAVTWASVTGTQTLSCSSVSPPPSEMVLSQLSFPNLGRAFQGSCFYSYGKFKHADIYCVSKNTFHI